MGLFGGNSFQRDNSKEVLEAEAKTVRQRISDIKKKTPMENLIELRQKEKIARLKKGVVGRSVRGSRAVGFELGKAVDIGQRQQVTFSKEQEMLGEMFGQGEHIWGTNNQPVTINNDLNPSRSDPYDETAGMFGWGGDGEKSGLF